MRHSHTLLMALATMLGVTLADQANAQAQQGQPRARRAPVGGQTGAGAARAPAAQGARSVDSARNRGPGRGLGAGRGLGMGSPVASLLRLRGQLALTDDQVKRLEAMQGAALPAPNQAEALRARADLLDAMKGDGNLQAARTAMDRMNKQRTDRAIAQLKLRQDARAVLTAEQKTKLDNMRSAQGMRQRFGPPMGPQGGQMGPGMGTRMGPPGGMMPRMRRGVESDGATTR